MTREEAIKTLRELWRETNDPWYEEVYNMAIEALSADAVQGWIPVSDIRKLEDILLMKINSFEGTRNIVEKGMLEVWKEVVEYIDGMLGEDGEA